MISASDGEIYLKLGPKGEKNGSSNVAWDDSCGGDVKQICICHGAYINSIQTTYERSGIAYVSDRHGGTEGNFDVISLNEPLIWVSGHYGSWCLEPEIWADEEEAPYNYTTVIRSLKFGTDRETYGPFGREVGEPFRYSSRTGICGFHGYCWDGDHGMLKAIGVYVRSMAARRINNDPIPTMAMAALAVTSPSLQDTSESTEKSITPS